MTFNYVGPAAPLKELESRTLPHGRFYKTDGGWMPSVTTVVGHNTKAGILAWEKRVGYTEAERVRRAASWRGTQYHTIVEHYLKNELEEVKESKGLPQYLFRLLVRLLIVFLTFTVIALFIVLSWGLLVVLIALLSLITL